MFDAKVPPPPPPTPGEIAADTPMLAALGEAVRAENRAAFGKVDTATTFYTRWMDRRDCVTERHLDTWAHAGLAEIGARLACSHTTAEQHTDLGTALRERLPATRAAFAAGELDYAKARRIATATAGFSDPVIAAVEQTAVQLAARYAPARFATEIDALLIRTAPDEYADLRRDTEKWARRVRRRHRGTLSRIEADLSPEEAAAVWQRITEVAATVCAHDPRGAQHRLVDAYLAIVHGEDHLACTCQRPDCVADPTPASRRKPLVQIVVDAATLLGLCSEPAFLPGHGPIDPDLARKIAADAAWQGVLTELVDLAVAAGILTPEQAATSTPPTEAGAETETETAGKVAADAAAKIAADAVVADPADAAEESVAAPTQDAATDTDTDTQDAATDTDTETQDAATDTDTETQDAATDTDTETQDAATDTDTETQDAATDTDTDVEPSPSPDSGEPASLVESALHTRLCHPLLATFVARGTRRPSGFVPSCAPTPVLVPLGQADLYVEYTKLIDAHPDLANGIHPDGHGGLIVPPPGALIYRPGAETAALVRARDRHCRFPHCEMPAERCQLDHIRPFDHDDPAAGGWTITSDLQCLCKFHHELKTAGLWHARALPGTAILWTGPRGDRHLTLPAGGLTPVPAATDLTPKVGGRRGQTEQSERPPDRDDPPF